MKRKKAYAYTRVSTRMQVEGYSLDAQLNKIKAQANLNDLEIIRTFSDEGKSGKSIEGREEFQKMLNYIASGEDVDYIIVYKLSRFGRNTRDVLESFEFIQDYGVNLISIEDSINTDKGTGKFLISILAAVSELERENIVSQTMEGRKEKARQGKWNGGQAPYGYILKDGLLEIDPESAEHIKLIYDLYLNENMGMARIAKHLNNHGYKRKPYKNGTLITFSAHFVKQVLDNPVYMGKIVYGRRSNEKVKGTRDKYKVVKQDDYIKADGIHDPIISEDVWQSVKAKRKETGVAYDKIYDLEHAHKLTGMIKCPVCGSNMYGNVSRHKLKDGSISNYYTYQCKHRRLVDGHSCTYNRQPRQEIVDSEVLDAIKDATFDDNFVLQVKVKMNANSDTKKLEQRLDEMKKNKKKLESDIRNLNRRLDELDIDSKSYQIKYDDIVFLQDKKYDDLAQIDEEISRMNEKINQELTTKASYLDAMRSVTENIVMFNKKSEQEQKEFYLKYIEKVEIFEDFDNSSRIVKSITFKFPMVFQNEDSMESDMVQVDETAWTTKPSTTTANHIIWDKEGHVESLILITRE
ncbi:recombinase family protein [Peptoniphilaceae bacterium SGI.131]